MNIVCWFLANNFFLNSDLLINRAINVSRSSFESVLTNLVSVSCVRCSLLVLLKLILFHRQFPELTPLTIVLSSRTFYTATPSWNLNVFSETMVYKHVR